MLAKWRLMCILHFFNMKTLLQLLLAQKLISSKCVLFKNNQLQGDTAPLRIWRILDLHRKEEAPQNLIKFPKLSPARAL